MLVYFCNPVLILMHPSAGKYNYEVTMQDSGVPSLTTILKGDFEVTEEPVFDEPKKAGAVNLWFLGLMLVLAYARRKYY
jgi:hypothetical protein